MCKFLWLVGFIPFVMDLTFKNYLVSHKAFDICTALTLITP